MHLAPRRHPENNQAMQKNLFMLALAGFVAAAAPAIARPLPQPPFTETLSNNTPLAFGMPIADAARALGTPLSWVSGSRGNEIYLAIRDVGGGGFFERSEERR